jgi:hypothetical protein
VFDISQKRQDFHFRYASSGLRVFGNPIRKRTSALHS